MYPLYVPWSIGYYPVVLNQYMSTIRPGLKERNLFINVIFSSPSHPPAQLRLLQKTFGFRFVLCTRFPVATKQCSISHEYLFRKTQACNMLISCNPMARIDQLRGEICRWTPRHRTTWRNRLETSWASGAWIYRVSSIVISHPKWVCPNTCTVGRRGVANESA